VQPVERAEYEGVDYAWVMQTTFVVTILVGAPAVAVLSTLVTLESWGARAAFAVRIGAPIWFVTAVAVALYARRTEAGDGGDGDGNEAHEDGPDEPDDDSDKPDDDSDEPDDDSDKPDDDSDEPDDDSDEPDDDSDEPDDDSDDESDPTADDRAGDTSTESEKGD